MAALRDVARNEADILREGIAWIIFYRRGRSWDSLALWSDLWNDNIEPEDMIDALEILEIDPNAIILNGYYCGRLGETMTVDELTIGIRWHYENSYNRLNDRIDIQQARRARSTELIEAALTDRCPGMDPEQAHEVAGMVVTMRITPEKMAQILDGLDRVAECFKELAAKLVEILKPVVEAVTTFVRRFYDVVASGLAPPRWIRLAKHAKKARIRKKYRDRIRRHIFATLASEGGGSS